MSDYRRRFVPGGTFYFTVVTYARRRILTCDHGRAFLRDAINDVRLQRPFDPVAMVLLPDHWHLLIQLPSSERDYSTRIKRIKEGFTTRWLDAGLPEGNVTPAQK